MAASLLTRSPSLALHPTKNRQAHSESDDNVVATKQAFSSPRVYKKEEGGRNQLLVIRVAHQSIQVALLPVSRSKSQRS